MTYKFIGFRADEKTLKKVNDLKKHLQKFSLGEVGTSDVLRHAIEKIYEEYKK